MDHFWSNPGFLAQIEDGWSSLMGIFDQNNFDLINKQSLWATQFSLLYEFFKRHNIVPTYETPFWLETLTIAETISENPFQSRSFLFDTT